MAEMIEGSPGLESTTIGIYRTAATVKGGRRFSFGALVALGDRNGSVAIGYGKAPGVPAAIEKAQKDARKKMTRVNLIGGTVPHQIIGEFLSSRVKLIPASPGTGVIAGATVRAVLELAGVHDCLTKSMGSNNQKNLAKATLQGLMNLRTKQSIADLRGVELGKTIVEEKVERGSRHAPMPTTDDAPEPAKTQPPKPEKKAAPAKPPAASAEAADDASSATAVAEPPADDQPQAGDDETKTDASND